MLQVTPTQTVRVRRLPLLTTELRSRVAAALAQTAATQQALAGTLEKVQAAGERIKSLQEGNKSLRTEIGGEQIKLQAAAQVLLEQEGPSAIYEELLSNLQDSRAEAQAFMRVSHFIMDEALSRKESLNAHT
ncbi:hypothetical protein COCSUDRAFT_63865 [Coccomyxa subellipsoidea C-169]|uniref:Uncharacterized protein n=1 Tax=Coccomyxa subellipsoidea (strain C-169) TaxID=574566 RepID=I0YWF9_COCSC|nr:hypothetical protein COCSUDRAFT_63865 [Coccomyxa subellipsoidea C-169]EIE22728.1 hypothetical protein COCSUDRAFT_63865 [Coccomyxa subellipsoidea C-169]|eukprot:XP_005647272.1 hypothetical protein COCSUDRAFT_63865 [Coccomyxa subellipsoidea C-169]